MSHSCRLIEETLQQFNAKQRHSSHILPRNYLGLEAQDQGNMGKIKTNAVMLRTETKTKTENTASRLPRDEALPRGFQALLAQHYTHNPQTPTTF